MEGFNPFHGVSDNWLYLIAVIAILGIWKAIELMVMLIDFLSNHIAII